MKTMTIRNLPDDVSAYIAKAATADGRSVNAQVVLMLNQSAGLAPRPKRKRDLSWLNGSWSEAEYSRFEKTTAECRRVEKESWT